MYNMKKRLLNPIVLFVVGLMLGVISRILDINTQNLGNIFSQMAIWILFGVIISVYSSSKKESHDKHISVLYRYVDCLLYCCNFDKWSV